MRRTLPFLRPRRYSTKRHSNRPLSTKVQQSDDPLRILFCGSDEFSIASLRALHNLLQESGSNVLSIDVLCKEDKPSGRGLKKLKAPLIKSVSKELQLPLHQLNTFRGWTPSEFITAGSSHINLIVAVSFGLLIPSRLIQGSKYGGLNVHPSLLPDLKGAAPLNWAIINGYSHTGVSIQTLHPTKFDEGSILAQTEQMPIPQNVDVKQLRDIMAPVGARLLVETIRSKRYLEPLQPITQPSSSSISFAPKILPSMKLLNPFDDSTELVLRKNRAIPRLFAYALRSGDVTEERIRLLFPTTIRQAESTEVPHGIFNKIGKGIPFAITSVTDEPSTKPLPIYVFCQDDECLAIPQLLIAGRNEAPASQAAAGAKLFGKSFEFGQHRIHPFQGPLMIDAS